MEQPSRKKRQRVETVVATCDEESHKQSPSRVSHQKRGVIDSDPWPETEAGSEKDYRMPFSARTHHRSLISSSLAEQIAAFCSRKPESPVSKIMENALMLDDILTDLTEKEKDTKMQNEMLLEKISGLNEEVQSRQKREQERKTQNEMLWKEIRGLIEEVQSYKLQTGKHLASKRNIEAKTKLQETELCVLKSKLVTLEKIYGLSCEELRILREKVKGFEGEFARAIFPAAPQGERKLIHQEVKKETVETKTRIRTIRCRLLIQKERCII
ncbi:hypothetical protein KP509_16G031100 [Ceratopteris richardii]|uniref:Uncharacterized protein n=1 Tax=Ceratopteris richardii TaxID=49495 RepID=A0A8T2T188_CERRI|nr:hypothetical protein KP509_16G031100 [Ceratopteris richardii]